MLRQFGKFNLLRPLGRGAMGEVYLAEDPLLGRPLAIKTIRRSDAATEEARERFLHEARAAAVLNHPSLVTLHEFGEVDGTLFLAMEYVEGKDLEALLRERALTVPELLEVLAQVSEGLAYAHAKGVIHRDVKPSNIRVLREDDKVVAKVMDFGIAKLRNSDMTGTGTLMGTFGYMAPEYIQTGHAEASCDLFAVGVILYEALSGHRPFEGDTTATVLYKVVNEEPAPIDFSLLPGTNPMLNGVVSKALAKAPYARFESGTALAQALREAKDPVWGLPEAPPTTRISYRPEVELDLPPETSPSEQPTAMLPRAAMAPPRAAGPSRAPLFIGLALLAALAGAAVWWRLRPKPVPVITLDPSQVAPKAEPKKKKGPKEDPLALVEAEAWLDQAEAGLLTTPNRSLALAERVVRDHPNLPRARAMEVAARYHAGRYGELPGSVDRARKEGILPRELLSYRPFRDMLAIERTEHRLPEEVRSRMAERMPLAMGAGPRR